MVDCVTSYLVCSGLHFKTAGQKLLAMCLIAVSHAL